LIHSWRRRRRSHGQSLVELALVLPILLVLVLITVDFGRALYGWVIVQNSTRIAANFASVNPDGWKPPGDPAVRLDYVAQVERDFNTANCIPDPVPTPAFADGPDTAVGGGYADTAYDVGDTVIVNLSCTFRPITPIISALVGNNVVLGARSEFRIRSGDLVGLANPTRIPAPGPTPTPTGTPVPTPSGTPTPTPTPPCVVSVTISRAPNGTVDAGTSVRFSATVAATGCSVSSYAWTFPSGTPGTAATAGPHDVTFSNATGSQQVYVVGVTVTTNTGATATDTEDVRVRSS
jgi:hypothetical protein